MDTSAALLGRLPALSRSTEAGHAHHRPADPAQAVVPPFAAVLQSVWRAVSVDAGSMAEATQDNAIADAAVKETEMKEADTEAGQRLQSTPHESGLPGDWMAAVTALPVWTPDSPPTAWALMQWVVETAGTAGPAETIETVPDTRPAPPSLLPPLLPSPAVDRAMGEPAPPVRGFALPMAGAAQATDAAAAAAVAAAETAATLPTPAGESLPRTDTGSGAGAPPWQLVSAGAPVVQAGAPVVAPAQTWIQTPVTQPGFSDDVVVELVRRVGQAEQGLQTVTLHLNPQALGPVSVSIELSGSTARIAFEASEAVTRQHLEASLPGLADALRAEGVALLHGQVHEATPQALAEAAGEASTGGAGTGSDARARGEAATDAQGRSTSGERGDRQHAPPEHGAYPAAAGTRAPGLPPVTSGRAGHLDLFA